MASWAPAFKTNSYHYHFGTHFSIATSSWAIIPFAHTKYWPINAPDATHALSGVINGLEEVEAEEEARGGGDNASGGGSGPLDLATTYGLLRLL